MASPNIDSLKPDSEEARRLVKSSGKERCESLLALASMYRAFLKAWAHDHLPDPLRKRVNSSSVVQESFLRFQEGVVDFRARSVPQFEQYLLRTAQNVIVDLRRFHLAKRRSMNLDQSLEELESAAFWDTMKDLVSEPADQRLEAVDEAEHRANRIQKALLQLPKHYQRVIRSRFELGWSTARIAKKLECTEGAARELLRRAVARLKLRLAETDDGQTSK